MFLKHAAMKMLGIVDESENRKINLNNYRIKDRQVLVQLNNSWKDLMQSEAVCSLDEPDQHYSCVGQNSIQLAKYLPHPLVAFQIKVVYTAILPQDRGETGKAKTD